MMKMLRDKKIGFAFLLFLALFFLPVPSMAHVQKTLFENEAFSHVPVAFEGRFRPLEAYVRMKHGSDQEEELLRILPSRHSPGTWLPLSILKTQADIGNFTPYPDELFENIRATYLALEETLDLLGGDAQLEQEVKGLATTLAAYLNEGYRKTLAGKVFQEAAGKQLTYPSVLQLQAEVILYRYPFLEVAIASYFLSLLFWILFQLAKKSLQRSLELFFLWTAFAIHTAILGLRCYILGRPPVSNMFETVIYVPWVAVATGLVLHAILKNSLIPLCASFTAFSLLLLLKLTGLNGNLQNVQAVLDSHYWLVVHVLMVVGSYAFFLLSGVFGHLYLLAFAKHKQESAGMEKLAKLVLQTMYVGTALLILGTILGGVWAAQSWGRFWDWDPKEAWAFISASVYLIWIHAYRFGKVHNFGLAVGSVVGLQAISFTWYGVNYLLGTGLHSYGFGSGGEGFYALFFLAEMLFLAYIIGMSWRTPKLKEEV